MKTKTKLRYLDDTYLFEYNATVIEIKENNLGKAIILDETIFYPQGGGQPTDIGIIKSKDSTFIVKEVKIDENGIVWHFGEFTEGEKEFELGEKVTLKIDKERRILNAKLHSAGHLIVYIVSKLELNNLRPIKGFHFPEGPYVEFEGTLENPEIAILIIEKAVNDLLKQDLKVKIFGLNPEEAVMLGLKVPEGKNARVVSFGNFPPFGCGGTHVNSTTEIEKITIRKIKSRKGRTRIAYSVE